MVIEANTSRATRSRVGELRIYPARLTSKGQVTVPKAVRDRFNMRAGDEIAFVEDATGVRIRKQRTKGAFRKWHGYLKNLKGADIDRKIAEMRGR